MILKKIFRSIKRFIFKRYYDLLEIAVKQSLEIYILRTQIEMMKSGMYTAGGKQFETDGIISDSTNRGRMEINLVKPEFKIIPENYDCGEIKVDIKLNPEKIFDKEKRYTEKVND